MYRVQPLTFAGHGHGEWNIQIAHVVEKVVDDIPSIGRRLVEMENTESLINESLPMGFLHLLFTLNKNAVGI